MALIECSNGDCNKSVDETCSNQQECDSRVHFRTNDDMCGVFSSSTSSPTAVRIVNACIHESPSCLHNKSDQQTYHDQSHDQNFVVFNHQINGDCSNGNSEQIRQCISAGKHLTLNPLVDCPEFAEHVRGQSCDVHCSSRQYTQRSSSGHHHQHPYHQLSAIPTHHSCNCQTQSNANPITLHNSESGPSYVQCLPSQCHLCHLSDKKISRKGSNSLSGDQVLYCDHSSCLQRSPSFASKLDENQITYLPFIIVVIIITISTSFLIVASVLYIKYLPFQDSSLIHEGTCGCAFGGQCNLDTVTGSGVCKCDAFKCDQLSRESDSLCGTDNTTYQSECHLNLTSCNLQKLIAISHRGPCETESRKTAKAGCDTIKCDNGSVCVLLESTNQPSCQCLNCSHNYEPVCGSDGLFYTNQCVMQRESCREGRPLERVHAKECGGCSNVHCQFYSNCKINPISGDAECLCPGECSPNEDPVCGTDGNTYANDCELSSKSCRSQKYIAIASKGACDLCINVLCQYGSHCESGLCVCTKECPTIKQPVCSTQGTTYMNECLLRLDGCQRRMDLSIAFFGQCQEIDDSQMRISDLSGYMDVCDQNSCRFGGVCDYDTQGIAHCVCPHQCPSVESDEDSLCGSDGRLYESECALQKEACRRQRKILPQPREKCEQSTVIPCDGELPLIDPVTGLEYHCGDLPGSKHCPPNSYCHRDGSFAKCCKRLENVENCSLSAFGCCPDGITSALGIDGGGCPSKCNCHKLGSYSAICDPLTSQCYCRPNVAGIHCDRCKPGFWGLHMIFEGNNGCIPCSCNRNGSVRDDCEQMTGRCVCKQNLLGIKCDVCPRNALLFHDGCYHERLTKHSHKPCDQMNCLFGSVCRTSHGLGSKCVCENNCTLFTDVPQHGPVCASDGLTYPSGCDLKLHACRMQTKLTVSHAGVCPLNNQSLSTQQPLHAFSSFSSSPVLHRTTVLEDARSTRELRINSQSEQILAPTDPTFAGPRSITNPAFFGESSIELSSLRAQLNLRIELLLTSYANFGIILYNGQAKSGDGDFVSISINHGFVEFRYDLGSGMTVLRSRETIKLGENFTIKALRKIKKGTLIVDNQKPVHGESGGFMKSLDLAENLHLGMVWTDHHKIYRNIGTREGLIGCMFQVKINDNLITFDPVISSHVLKIVRVHECDEAICSWFKSRSFLPSQATDKGNSRSLRRSLRQKFFIK